MGKCGVGMTGAHVTQLRRTAADRRKPRVLVGARLVTVENGGDASDESRGPGWRKTTKRWCRDNSRCLIPH